MRTFKITTPSRKTFSIHEFSILKTLDAYNNAEVIFITEEGKAYLLIVIRKSGKHYKIDAYHTVIPSIERHIQKYFIGKDYSVEQFDERYKILQKRLKEQVRDITRHIVESAEPVKQVVETVKQGTESVKKIVLERPKSVGLEGQIHDLVYNALESDFTRQTIENKMIELGIEPNRLEVVVKEKGKEPVNVGAQHSKFPIILKTIKAKVNVALVGPAGSGKTTAVKSVAKALNLDFYTKSVSAQTGTHEFFGYQDANGNYVKTLFREAYEKGGVFLLDEFDAGNPNVLAALNQATANGETAFADKMVSKHKDFIIVMAGNTYGFGATLEYVGRNKIDAATLDRFAFIHFDYDEKFEYNLATNKEWCKEVQALRKKAREKRIKTIISPRATFEGSKLLSVGLTKTEVMDILIFKGMSADERKLLS